MENNKTLAQNVNSLILAHPNYFLSSIPLIGIVLVIYYCTKISHYPPGISISDTLFFIWALFLFIPIYTVVAYGFIISTMLWLAILKIPIYWLINIKAKAHGFEIPRPETNWILILTIGLLYHALIIGVYIISDTSITYLFGSLFTIAMTYLILDYHENKHAHLESNKYLTNMFDNHKNNKPEINFTHIKGFFYALICVTPLLFGSLAFGVTKGTFTIMGVIQHEKDISVSSKVYKPILKLYEEEVGEIDYECRVEICTIYNTGIIFTGIGNSTKIEISGSKKGLEVTIPNNAIHMSSKTIEYNQENDNKNTKENTSPSNQD